MDIYDRNSLWVNQKSKRLEEFRKSADEKDIFQCTFQPNVDKSTTSTVAPDSRINQNGVDSHLRRQMIARQQKEERELKLACGKNTLVNSPPKKSSALTIPKAPALGASRKKTTSPNANRKSTSPGPSKNYKKVGLEVNFLHFLFLSWVFVCLKDLVDKSVPSLKISDVNLGEAVRILHEEIGKFDIKLD